MMRLYTVSTSSRNRFQEGLSEIQASVAFQLLTA